MPEPGEYPLFASEEEEAGNVLARASLATDSDVESVLEFFNPGSLGRAFSACKWTVTREVQVLIDIMEDKTIPADKRMAARQEMRTLMLDTLGMHGYTRDVEVRLTDQKGQSLQVKQRALSEATRETEELLMSAGQAQKQLAEVSTAVERSYVSDSEIDIEDSRIGGFSRKPTDAREFASERTPDERSHELSGFGTAESFEPEPGWEEGDEPSDVRRFGPGGLADGSSSGGTEQEQAEAETQEG